MNILFPLKHTIKVNSKERGFFLLEFFINKMLIDAVMMILVGIIALRLAGRKSLSQMTISQAVIMIAIGSILVEPVKEEGVVVTVLTIFLFVLVLYFLEVLSLEFPFFERLIIGKSKIVIEKGKINYKNIKKLRMTEDQLDMILRQNKVGEISHVQIATLEANGQFGYELIEEARPLTIGEFKRLTGSFFDDYQKLNEEIKNFNPSKNLFDEVKREEEENDKI
jgi:uncharacterized membrane protein YcaP (DUF421 family)